MEIDLKKANQFIYFTPLLILLLLIAAWKYALHPHLASWIKGKLPEFNAAQEYVDVDFNDLHISLLKLQFSATDVTFSFKNKFSRFNFLKIAEVRAQINPFELLIGQLNLNSIVLDNLNWELTEAALTATDSEGKTKPSEIPIDLVFKYLPQIPVNQVKLQNANFKIISKAKKLTFQSHAESVTVENLKNRLNLTLFNLNQTFQYDSNSQVSVSVDLALSLNAQQLKINNLQINNSDSSLRLQGQFRDLKTLLSNPVGDLTLESTILCDNMRTLYLSLLPQKSRMPSLSGKIQSSGKLSINGLTSISGQFEINTTNLSVDHFKFGKAQIKAQIKKNQLHLDQISIEHPAGFAELNQIDIEQAKPYLFKTKLNVKTFNLQKLLISLGLNLIPADLDLTGTAACQGQLLPPFNIECTTEAALSHVVIKSTFNDPFSIIKIKQGQVKGSILFNDEDIQFDSHVMIGTSAGTARGVIDLQKGFQIDFASEQLKLIDIESLAGLDLKGQVKIAGTTWGDSSHGSLETDLTADQAEIEKFNLGHFSTELKYEKGNLFFRKIDGKLGQSNIAGALNFNFMDSVLNGNIDSSNIHGEDIYFALNKKFDLPFELSGIGQAHATLSGPFNFWKLKYDLSAFLKQGSIAEEGFERLDLNLVSDGKKIDFKDVRLAKLKSQLTLSGSIVTALKQPEFNLLLKSNQAYIEEIDAAAKLLPTLTGMVAVNGTVNGRLDSPEVKMNFNARQVNLDGFNYPPSQGQLGLDKKYLTMNGQLFGRQIQANLKWPWKEKDDYFLKLQVRDLNPLLLLPLISIPQPNSEFYSRLNLDVDLVGENKTIQKTSGRLALGDFLLQRGGQTIRLRAPASLIFDHGLKKMDPIDLSGEESHINIHLLNANTTDQKLNFELGLKIRLLQFLVPFVDSMNGFVEAQAQMPLRTTGSLQIFGEGQLTDGSVQLKGFPSPIEAITTPLEFSQSKIILSEISAQIGNSELNGSGQIEIKGSKNLVVKLQAQADNLELTFPEKITTGGKASLNFSGSWLPYTLKVDYKVNRGLVEKDFGQDNASNVTLRGSHFLPAQQIESQSPSLLLDIAIDLSQGIIVKNKLLEGSASGNLEIKGTPENPIILGKIDIKPGSKIIFKDKTFEVQTARINFTDTTDTNPDIYISAIARVSDYDINILVQGPAKSPTIAATSQPPLSKGDIFSLLALGMTSTKMDQNLSSDLQQKQTEIEIIAALTNQSQFNKKLQETLGLNVQLAPSVDSTRNIAVPKVVVSKQIVKKLNASYAKPLTGDQNQEVKLQYLFNHHWSGILNYQNKESNQQGLSPQNQNQNEKGILGGEFEYKREFKW